MHMVLRVKVNHGVPHEVADDHSTLRLLVTSGFEGRQRPQGNQHNILRTPFDLLPRPVMLVIIASA